MIDSQMLRMKSLMRKFKVSLVSSVLFCNHQILHIGVLVIDDGYAEVTQPVSFAVKR